MGGVNSQAVWLAVRIGYNHSVWAVVWGLTPWSRICPSRVWCLWRPPFGYGTCTENEVALYCSLKPVIWCVGSGSSWERLWWESVTDTFWGCLLGATKWLMVGCCLCRDCVHMNVNVAKLWIEAGFYQYQAKGRSYKGARHPKTHPHLLVAHKTQPLKEPQAV